MNPQLTNYLARARAEDLLRQAKAANSVGGNERDAGEHSHPQKTP